MTRLVIFRRDLRAQDNSALIAAAESGEDVLPLFILDETLIARWQHAEYRMLFMTGALKSLQQSLKALGGVLHFATGKPDQVLGDLLSAGGISGVHINRDYTPFARRRDASLKSVCDAHGVAFSQHADQLLNEPEAVFKSDGGPYTVFTPYYRRACTHLVGRPQSLPDITFKRADTLAHDLPDDWLFASAPAVERDKVLAGLAGLGEYADTRDIPAIEGTSRLSSHLRFGTCSPREVYWTVSRQTRNPEPLLRQLYWRDFYHQIGYHFPHVYTGAFRRQYDRLTWDNNDETFERWCQGETGFPIVDAGMRELAATGYMHNRVRMVVASFLVKNLNIDWRKGESHFGKYLIDYDPALNNGNWQWGASTGCDAQPYFRVFNPWRQQARFDPDATYIKKWIPELKNLTAKEIHKLEKDGSAYLPQIVDLKLSAEASKLRFKELNTN